MVLFYCSRFLFIPLSKTYLYLLLYQFHQFLLIIKIYTLIFMYYQWLISKFQRIFPDNQKLYYKLTLINYHTHQITECQATQTTPTEQTSKASTKRANTAMTPATSPQAANQPNPVVSKAWATAKYNLCKTKSRTSMTWTN